MLKLFLLILKELWPYVKQALLKDGSVRDWFRTHAVSLTWFAFLLAMFGIILWILDVSIELGTRNRALVNELNKARAEYVMLYAEHEQLKEREISLRSDHLELVEQERDLTDWLDNCGIHHAHLMSQERCPVERPRLVDNPKLLINPERRRPPPAAPPVPKDTYDVKRIRQILRQET